MPGKLELIASSIIPIALGIIGYRMHLQISREASVTTLSTLPKASWPDAYDPVGKLVNFIVLAVFLFSTCGAIIVLISTSDSVQSTLYHHCLVSFGTNNREKPSFVRCRCATGATMVRFRDELNM